MVNIFPYIPIESHGMSQITVIFFFGVFVSIGALFWWMRREIGDIDAELASHKLRLNDAQKEVSAISVELGKIRVTVENTESMTGKLINHILK